MRKKQKAHVQATLVVRREKFTTLHLVYCLCLISLLLVGGWYFMYDSQPNKASTPQTTPTQGWTKITKEDFVMEPDEAVRFTKETIQPAVQSALDDPLCPPGISNRIALLFKAIENGEIEYTSTPYYLPKNKGVVGRLELDPTIKKLRLSIFVPAIKDLYASYVSDHKTEAFKWFAAIVYAHEEAHFEYRKQHPNFDWDADEVRSLNEADTWGVTILEMIRPLQKIGADLPENYIHNSEEFKKINDNPNDLRWVAQFSDYEMRN